MTPLTKAQIEAMMAEPTAKEIKHHRSGEAVLTEVFADPGTYGWYYREKKPDSVARFVRFEVTDSLARTAIALHDRVAELEGALRTARDLSQTANSDDVYLHCIATLERTTP